MIRANVLITEFWDNQIRTLAGWHGYQMARQDGEWRIRTKQVNLIECDQCLRNPSIVF
jgi:benzoate/toluate 1,2-dioxygenase beta subunit